jgi:cytochrome c biogenesis protein ResB
MDHLILISICAVVSLQVLVFIGGIFVGRMIGNSNNNNSLQSSVFSGKVNNKKEKPNILIDSKTFVTDIKTEGMEKKFTTMTETTNTSVDISNSISKLKNLKN